MIFDLIFAFLRSVVTALLTLIPSYDLPASVSNLGGDLGGAVAGANAFFPVEHVGICIGLVVGVRAFLMLWDVLVWLYDRLPFKAS